MLNKYLSYIISIRVKGRLIMLNNGLKKWIEENANIKVAVFTQSLIPNIKHKVYGVGLPLLNKKAKELCSEIECIKRDSLEEILLQAYAVGWVKDIDKQIKEIKKFVPIIDNWMVCDSFCSALKSAKKYPDKYWDLLLSYVCSKKDYEQRFAYVMMLKYFCNEKYLDNALDILINARPRIWDTKQGVAWAITEFFVKFEDKTKEYLKKLTPELFKLTRRKILDSKRVSERSKKWIKNENHVHLCE